MNGLVLKQLSVCLVHCNNARMIVFNKGCLTSMIEHVTRVLKRYSCVLLEQSGYLARL